MARLIIFITLLFPSFSNASTTLLFYEDYAPYSGKDSNGPVGLFADIVMTIFDKMNIPVETEVLPFKRAMLKGYLGEGIVVGIYKTPERLEKLQYSDGFFLESIILFQNKTTPFKYSGINSLKNRSIGCRLGFSYGASFDKAKKEGLFQPIGKNDYNNLLRLSKNRIDGLVMDKEVGNYLIRKHSLKNIIPVLSPTIHTSQVYIAARKDKFGKIIERFNLELSKLKQTPEYQELISKYK